MDSAKDAFHADVDQGLRKLGVTALEKFGTELAVRHEEIDHVAHAVDAAADAKEAEITAIDLPVQAALQNLETQAAALQTRLDYAAGNESAIRDTILKATRHTAGVVSTTEQLLTSSAAASKELLAHKAQSLVEDITRDANGLSSDVRGRVHMIANGAASKMEAVLADEELSEKEKAEQLRAIDAAMQENLKALGGDVAANVNGLLSLEEMENAYGTAMTKDERKLARRLHELQAAQLTDQANEKKQLAVESARLGAFVDKITAAMSELWEKDGKELTKAQIEALSNLRSLG